MTTEMTTPKTQEGHIRKVLSAAQSRITAYLSGTIDPSEFALACFDCFRDDNALFNATVNNPDSFIQAVCVAAKLGLRVGSGPAAEAYLIPFAGAVQCVPSYQGLLKLVYNTGTVLPISADVIYSNDLWHYSKEPPLLTHTPTLMPDRGEIIGAYAILRMKDCPEYQSISFKSKIEIDAVRDKAPGSSRPNSVWKTHYGPMAIKTVIRAGFKTWPKSHRMVAALNLPDPDLDVKDRSLGIAQQVLATDFVDDRPVFDADAVAAGTPALSAAPAPAARPSTDQHASRRAEVRELANYVGIDRASQLLDDVGIKGVLGISNGTPDQLASAKDALQKEKMQMINERAAKDKPASSAKETQPDLIPDSKKVNP